MRRAAGPHVPTWSSVEAKRALQYLAVWRWASSSPSLGLRLPISKMEQLNEAILGGEGCVWGGGWVLL